ncbi:multicopper oxidase domain-containing protein [Devriesea agamarum]|uniref:multicopper oxidase domain-containing protein n=1 Tax=Devriesea agamarum TaxID=472569 RepID=UPI000B1FF36A|nr:multicopper oxidase domain-containing protein [Devriesea agamarum]
MTDEASAPTADPTPSSNRPRHSPPGGRRSWHRQASRPISWWLFALVVLAFIHPWVPQSRWLLVHMVTLGLITTSIMIWGQHFTEALLKIRLPDSARSVQVWRIRALTVGIIVVGTGIIGGWPWVTVAGAVVVGGCVTWYALDLLGQLRRALPSPFRSTVRFYITAALLLPVGATFGALLAFSPPSPWQGRLLLAHQAINLLGFVGLTAVGTLITLWPTVLRTRMVAGQAQTGYRVLIALAAGMTLIVAGALLGFTALVVAGLVVYLAGLLWFMTDLVRCAHAQPPVTFPAMSIAAGVLWLLGTLIGLLVLLLTDPHRVLVAGDIQGLTVPYVAGFLVQLLFGAMSYLMPTVMGGGPAPVRAGLRETDRFGVARVIALNTSLVLYLLIPSSTVRVAVAFVAFISLGMFIPLIIRMVKANLRARRDTGRAQQALHAQHKTPDTTPNLAAHHVSNEHETPVNRRHFAEAVLGIGTALGAVAVGRAADPALTGPISSATSDPDGNTRAIRPTGHTTRIKVTASGMRFHPQNLTVPVGDHLILTVTNTDPTTTHDLALDNGAQTRRLSPGASQTLDVGVIRTDIHGWCTIVGHRAMGMVLNIRALRSAGTDHTAADTHGNTDAHDEQLVGVPERQTVDLTAPPGPQYQPRHALLPAVPPGRRHQIDLTAEEVDREFAPGFTQRAMTYNGLVMGPILHAHVGDEFAVHLVNKGSMGHSIDFHAGTVSPQPNMRTIAPGQSLDYEFTAHRSGIWLYHCSTMPMSAHIASGMFGAVIVRPPSLSQVAREYVLVQSEAYLGPRGGNVDMRKIADERPDLTMFNGHANQYVHAPLTARVGERIRFWVLAAGPSRGISFHIVGAQFDTVFKEGAYLLRPDNPDLGGSQALDLASCQGGFVETVFEQPGTYTFVNHSFVDMERGARGLITVTT